MIAIVTVPTPIAAMVVMITAPATVVMPLLARVIAMMSVPVRMHDDVHTRARWLVPYRHGFMPDVGNVAHHRLLGESNRPWTRIAGDAHAEANPRARIMRQNHSGVAAVVTIRHLISADDLADVVGNLAALYVAGDRHRMSALIANVVSNHCADRSAHGRGGDPAVTLAYGMAEQSTGDGADDGTTAGAVRLFVCGRRLSQHC